MNKLKTDIMKITRVGIVLVLAASMFIMPACKKEK